MKRASALGLLLGLSVMGCEGGYGRDGTFDRWCGKSLCDWQTDEGEIKRVSTWHVRDYGVELVANPTQISSDSRYTDSYAACMRFSVVADIARSAQVVLEIDFGEDGSVDFQQYLTGENYTLTEFVVPFPEYRFGARYTIRKTGPGRARIADLAVQQDDDCETRVTQPDGRYCESDDECTHGVCVLGSCSACGESPCAEGAGCSDDAQCLSGVCSAGLCSQCGADGTCAAGSACNVDTQCASGSCLANFTPESADSMATLAQCAECATDDDCAEGHCLAGACAACRDDADCSDGEVCRYPSASEAGARACRAPLTEALGRGALCEQDADCADGLACGAPEGLAPRCGRACAAQSDCEDRGFCISPGRGLISCFFGSCEVDALLQVSGVVASDASEVAGAGTCHEFTASSPTDP